MGWFLTCGFTPADGHQSSSAQDFLGVGGQRAPSVAAPALGDGVSTPLMELHLCTNHSKPTANHSHRSSACSVSPCATTQPMPASLAFLMASCMQKFPTTGPRRFFPSTSAVPALSFSTTGSPSLAQIPVCLQFDEE
ncbi:hypothetical protein EYF80_022368 [Liparis tanakae]|uniref:Uncharacterized protein n=1 Tax=Liparis tanakae TaxID=230148 RepID=A0A4Z2HQZ2_9TELE|nr:hypothetical protein EYF80_022368 [Liparis tanakae]